MFVAGGRNETKKRRLLKLIKQQLFALSATRSIGFCIKLPVPVVTVSAPLSGSRSAIAASASSACCQRPQAWQYAASTITSMAVSMPRTCSWGATLYPPLAQVDPTFSRIATNDFEQSRCRRVTLRK